MEADERLDYAVLISLYMREEAEVMAGALRADGIDAFISNTNHAGLNWFYLIALGGWQVMVPRALIADAKAAMRERVKENADAFPEDRVERNDRWKAWVMLGLVVGPAIGVAISDVLHFGVDWFDALVWVLQEVAYSR